MGEITGEYLDATANWHGFLRASDGNIGVFDVPGGTNTFPVSINSDGAITGYYASSGVGRSFLRSPSGAITTFEVPGEIGGTFAVSINSAGAIVGTCSNGTVIHGSCAHPMAR
jgi:hypothetical protein